MTAPVEPRQCTAKTKGKQCEFNALDGLNVCQNHGGLTPASTPRHHRALAARQLGTWGWRPDEGISPVDALLEELNVSYGLCKWIEARLDNVTPEQSLLVSRVRDWLERTGKGEGTDGPSLLIIEEKISVEGDVSETLTINPLIELYRAERAHLVKVADACIKAGVARMQMQAFVEASEAQSAKVVQVLERVANDPRMAGHASLLRAVIRDALAPLASPDVAAKAIA